MKTAGVVVAWGVALAVLAPQVRADDQDAAKKIIKDGLLGAGVGAVSASASGGKAGKGALIGAGTNVVGGAVLDMLTGSGTPREPVAPAYPPPAPTYQQGAYPQPVAAVGNDYQTGYQKGYQDGFQQGYQQGLQAGRSGR